MPRFAVFIPMVALLMALESGSVRAAEASASAVGTFSTLPSRVSTAARARHLLIAGQRDQAERLVSAALAVGGSDDSLLCLLGEIHFRRADFAEAARAFESAISLNPDNARAWWGLGRIEQANFRGQRARDLFSKAFSLNHRDTDIILAYADFVNDAASKAILLDNVARLARFDQPERTARALAQLQIQQRLQGRAPSRLASPYTSYRLPLTGFRPETAAQDGILVSARINGSRPLRLLLDTGARGIVIDARAARNLALETIVASRLSGFGGTGASESRIALARSVAFGGLAFVECLVEVTVSKLAPGADGVLGADIFAQFKIGVDAGAGILRLTPFDDPAAPPADRAPINGAQASIAAIGMRNLLLVKARVEGGKEGLFLVDTGAAFTVVSREHLPPTLQLGSPVELRGAQGPLSGAARVGPLAFRVGGVPVVESAPLAMDLEPISQLEGIDIAGILGYSTLGKSPFTIDLRNGIVEFARAATH